MERRGRTGGVGRAAAHNLGHERVQNKTLRDYPRLIRSNPRLLPQILRHVLDRTLEMMPQAFGLAVKDMLGERDG